MIGYFGDVIFETSDSKILTFAGFSLETAPRLAVHEVIGQKPKTEFIGPGLNKISFSIHLNGNHGVKPRDEMTKWIIKSNTGEANSLILGGKVLGADKWIVTNVSEAWDTFLNAGELFSGKIDVSLEEYITTLGSSTINQATQNTINTDINTNTTGTITATILNVRKSATVTSSIVSTIIKGAKVTILNTSGDWYQISSGHGNGYVYKKYVKV